MKKTMRVNASYALAAILSIVLFTALCGFAAVAAKSADAADTRQVTDYGAVDWTNAARGFITFTASGRNCVFIMQSPSGRQTSRAVDAGETVTVALADGVGSYQYAICRDTVNDGNAYLVNYKGSFVVGETNTTPAD